MAPSDLEAMIRNLNTRTTAIEQILPTLATKEDLTKGLDALKSQMLTLYENLKDDNELFAAHLNHIIETVDRLDRRT